MILNIDSEYLKELLDSQSRGLVGKVMKRHEIFDSTDKKLRDSEKELIYEEFRALFTLLLSAGRGVEKTYFDFKSRDSK
jgi:hypothetical protein